MGLTSPFRPLRSGDHAALKRLLRPIRGFRDLASAKATLKGIETCRAIRKAGFEGATKGAANEITFVESLFKIDA